MSHYTIPLESLQGYVETLSEPALMALYYFGDEEDRARLNETTFFQEVATRIAHNRSTGWTSSYYPYLTDKEIDCYFQNQANEGGMLTSMGKRGQDPIKAPDTMEIRKKIKELQLRKGKNLSPEEIKKINDELVRLGWNPEVPYNEQTALFAQNRMTHMYMDEASSFTFINATSKLDHRYDQSNQPPLETIKPVYVIYHHESGLCDVHIDKLPEYTTEFHGIDKPSASIYQFFIETDRLYTPIAFRLEPDGGAYYEIGLKVPETALVARYCKAVYEYFHYNIEGRLPIIQKLIKGPITEQKYNQIPEFSIYCMTNANASVPIDEDTFVIHPHNYITMNLINR